MRYKVCMVIKTYLSTISDAWPISRQRELLGARQYEYVDELKPATAQRAREAKDPDARDKLLKRRKELLAPSTRPAQDLLEVASFVCLAANTLDFVDVVQRASRRGMSIKALDTGRQITAGPGAEELAREIPFFQQALRQRGFGRTRGQYAAQVEEEG